MEKRRLTDEEFERLIAHMRAVGEEIDRRRRAETEKRAENEYRAFRRMGTERGQRKWWKYIIRKRGG